MFIFPETKEKLKARISSYKSAMNKEKKEYGSIYDGRGKRYVLFSLYFVLNDLKKFEQYEKWYNEHFPDDCGEPIQKLCWSLSLFRADKLKEARAMLGELMFSNLYMIPFIIGENIEEEHDIWHSSNFANMDYISDLPSEVKNNITDHEVEWIKEMYNSFVFRRVEKRYIEISHELKTTRKIEERRSLSNESDSLFDLLTKSD